MAFEPRFQYSHALVRDLGTVEAARAMIDLLPLPPDTSLLLRHDALQRSTRSSTRIEGNVLADEEVRRAIATGLRRGTAAEQEVRNYWRALDRVEDFSAKGTVPTEAFVQELHRIVIVRGPGRRGRRSAYRTIECPVVDTATRRVDYAPPEPRDVAPLMRELMEWLRGAAELPPPIRAGILTHRFLSIHPFDDGNGRTGRLLATAELWRSGYRMRGFLSFEEYFNADRGRYYEGLQMGLPVNFYEGRHDPDHTPWLAYFMGILARAADSLQKQAAALYRANAPAAPPSWEALSRRQQQVLTRLLAGVLTGAPAGVEVRPADVQEWFGVSANTARDWLREWVTRGFLAPVSSRAGLRVRRYRLGRRWAQVLSRAKQRSGDSTSGNGK